MTLEPGGKSPAITGPRAGPGGDFDKAITRLVLGKMLNAGQTCIAPDYAFIPRGEAARFVVSAKRAASELYPSLAVTADYTSIISNRYFQRLQALVDDAARASGRSRMRPVPRTGGGLRRLR